MSINYKIIYNSFDKYEIYSTVLKWDKKNTYCINKKEIDNTWMVEKMIAVYNNDELIGLGGILPNYSLNYASLSSIIKPKYRKKGIATRLLKEMLNYTKNELGINIVRVNVLKKNLTCINHIEKNNFEFVSFNDKVITFEKKLINEK